MLHINRPEFNLDKEGLNSVLNIVEKQNTEELTFLLSLSHVEKPFVSWYWSPKYQTSRNPMVLTTLIHKSRIIINTPPHHNISTLCCVTGL